jgi:two-component system chemotaxis response regulator CheB
MYRRDIIVIGASAGGVEALVELVRGLPADLPAAVFVVLHLPAHGTSVLPSILNRAGTLPAVHPHDGQKIQQGRIYVAPPDLHLLIRNGTVRVARGPRENRHRPAADALFRTAARA